MDDLLPKAALIELEKAQNKLRLGNTVKVKSRTNWLKKTLAWCSECEITLGHGDSEYFHISHEGINAIEQRYEQLGQGTLKQHVKALNGDRIQAVKVSDNEKLAKELPTEHLVLTACTDLNLRLAQQSLFGLTQTPLQINNELDVSSIDLSLFDYLIVVENRDCFNAWHEYQIQSSITRPLIVYRGHEKSHSKGCQELKFRWLNEKGKVGQVYFGDFDIAGLAIAVDIETAYQHLLLPPISRLSKQLKSSHFNERHAYKQRDLFHRCPVPWQPLLSLLLTNKAGLRQQWMFDHELELY